MSGPIPPAAWPLIAFAALASSMVVSGVTVVIHAQRRRPLRLALWLLILAAAIAAPWALRAYFPGSGR